MASPTTQEVPVHEIERPFIVHNRTYKYIFARLVDASDVFRKSARIHYCSPQSTFALFLDAHVLVEIGEHKGDVDPQGKGDWALQYPNLPPNATITVKPKHFEK